LTGRHDREVKRMRDGRVGQFAAQHGLHQLQSGFTGDLIGTGYAWPGTRVHDGTNYLFLCEPGVEVIGFGHQDSCLK
jgi:hypothetical protein